MTAVGKRLTILSKAEIKTLYSLPKFSEDERSFYFALADEEKKEMESLKSLESRVHFILQLGYFKSRSMFFHYSFFEASEDVHYVLNEYFPGCKTLLKTIGKRSCFDNHSRILRLLGYSFLEKGFKEKTIKRVSALVKVCVNPSYVFDGLCDFLKEHQIALPGYSTLQKIISQALLVEDQRLQSLIQKNISEPTDEALKKLLVSQGKMYGITVLKKDAKGFNPKEMTHEIKKKLTSAPLFKIAEQIIPKLDISEQNIRYYAYLVDYYTVDRLNELPYERVRVYLLCYVFYRFEKINDNLVSGFLYHINLYKKQAKEDGKEKVYEHKVEDNPYGEKIGQILDFFTDESLADNLPFGDVRTKAFGLIEKENFHLLKQNVTHQTFDEEEFRWDYYKEIAKTISRNLRPLVRAIDFENEDSLDPLMKALTFLQQTFNRKKSLKQIEEDKLPKDFIPASLKPYLYESEEKEGISRQALNVYQYEFLIYYQLEKALDSGRIFVNNSFSFKSLKKDLYQDWNTNKEDILKDLNNPILNTPLQDQLTDFKKELDPLLVYVNKRMEQGDNKEVTLKRNKDPKKEDTQEWTLSYPKNDKEINNPFYAQFHQAGLNKILRFVNHHCHFMDAFTHVKARYSKTKAEEDSIFACITANAANYGISQMAEISDISYPRLLTTSKNFIRLETLKNANDILVNNLADLPIFKQWNLLDNLLVSSLDGKKFPTRFKHIMARYSSKYFGETVGLVSYSMNANNVCTSTTLISPNEHESHHFYDLISHNTSDVQPDWHCGDTHSINRVNFALLHLVGQRFTPHIKNISKKACSLASFENPGLYEKNILIPDSQIKTKLLEEEWDNLQHIFASLLMKQTTQSVVVRKLSSYERSNKTQKALWEYDKILMSLHILKFIDDPSFRKVIRTALNRGEGYHQLTGKIAGVNGGKFRGTTELELFIWNECSRFIANCIIYYNALLLSKIYESQEKLGNTKALEFIKRLSPIAWRHINFKGRYEFTTITEDIDLDKMIANLVFDFEKTQGTA